MEPCDLHPLNITKMDQQLISVIIPMHNAEDYICEALGSILCERGLPIEVIVVDDRSTDNSMARVLSVRDERIRILEGGGAGIASCLNIGLADARGSIIMRCDADDRFTEGRIKRQVSWLRSHSEYAAVCGAFSIIDSKGQFVSTLPPDTNEIDITYELTSGIARTHLCTYAIRSELIAKVGGFRDFFESGEDIDFQLRLGELGRIFYLPEPFYFYRLHSASITHNQYTVLREYFSRMATELQRQRLSSGTDDLQRGCPHESRQ